jgi:membrane fusion protein YbhG
MKPTPKSIALLVLAAALVIAVIGWSGSRRGVTTARGDGSASTEVLEASGSIEGTLVRVASKLQGKVARVMVQEGANVTRGQLLIELDGTEIGAQVAQARAQLSTAAARLEEARAGTRPESVRQAEAELRRAVSAKEGAADAVQNLDRQLERSTELKQNLEAAQSQVSATRASLQAAVARRDRLKAGARSDELREAEEAVTGLDATARRAIEEEDRMHRAYDRGAVARREWDLAVTEREVAAANLAKGRARLADLRAGARPEELQEAEQQVAAARAAYDGARTSLVNARQLYTDRLPERQRLDAARADLRTATDAVAAARAQLDLLQNGTRPEVVRQLASQMDEARAALALAESHQRDLRIVSPVDGVVTGRSVEPGEVVLPGARLLELADLRDTWVRVYLPEKIYGRVRVDDHATVSTDSLPGQSFAGRVETISQESEYSPRSVQTKEERVDLMFAIKVDVENPRGELHIGMPVDVRFQ